LIETRDFLSFRMTPLAGAASRNKGMALFPRKLNGKYAMIGRRISDLIILPYAASDTFSNSATIRVAALMNILRG
jgi:predicted GH43/DUF377 family glycosyl hydrolase